MENSKKHEPEKRNLNDLNPEKLESVAGGYVYYASNHPDFKYEAIDDKTGNVLGRYKTFEEAKLAARRFGNTDEMIFRYSTLNKIREEGKKGLRDNLNKY